MRSALLLEGLKEEKSLAAVVVRVIATAEAAQTEAKVQPAAARKVAVGWVGTRAVAPLVGVAMAAHGVAVAVEGERAVVME